MLYTDGVVEAMRTDGELFGVERLAALMERSYEGADALASGIVRSVSALAGRDGDTLDDDCTVVVLEAAPVPVRALRPHAV